MNKLMNNLECGFITTHSKDAIVLVISAFKNINNNIIPIFNKYKIKGIKSLDFQDFCKAAEIMNKKAHLTSDGLEQIKQIKSNMNKGRVYI
jgi:hypothetical protein